MNGLLWEAFSGNVALEEVLGPECGADTVRVQRPHASGTERRTGRHPCYNVAAIITSSGLLCIDWPERTVQEHVFGDPEMRR